MSNVIGTVTIEKLNGGENHVDEQRILIDVTESNCKISKDGLDCKIEVDGVLICLSPCLIEQLYEEFKVLE